MNNAILFDKASFDKLLVEAPKYKMITISILSDRLRINCSLARRAIKALEVRRRISGAAWGIVPRNSVCPGGKTPGLLLRFDHWVGDVPGVEL